MANLVDSASPTALDTLNELQQLLVMMLTSLTTGNRITANLLQAAIMTGDIELDDDVKVSFRIVGILYDHVYDTIRHAIKV